MTLLNLNVHFIQLCLERCIYLKTLNLLLYSRLKMTACVYVCVCVCSVEGEVTDTVTADNANVCGLGSETSSASMMSQNVTQSRHSDVSNCAVSLKRSASSQESCDVPLKRAITTTHCESVGTRHSAVVALPTATLPSFPPNLFSCFPSVGSHYAQRARAPVTAAVNHTDSRSASTLFSMPVHGCLPPNGTATPIQAATSSNRDPAPAPSAALFLVPSIHKVCMLMVPGVNSMLMPILCQVVAPPTPPPPANHISVASTLSAAVQSLSPLRCLPLAACPSHCQSLSSSAVSSQQQQQQQHSFIVSDALQLQSRRPTVALLPPNTTALMSAARLHLTNVISHATTSTSLPPHLLSLPFTRPIPLASTSPLANSLHYAGNSLPPLQNAALLSNRVRLVDGARTPVDQSAGVQLGLVNKLSISGPLPCAAPTANRCVLSVAPVHLNGLINTQRTMSVSVACRLTQSPAKHTAAVSCHPTPLIQQFHPNSYHISNATVTCNTALTSVVGCLSKSTNSNSNSVSLLRTVLSERRIDMQSSHGPTTEQQVPVACLMPPTSLSFASTTDASH